MSDNSIDDFIDSIADGNFNQAEKMFNSLVQDKVNSALDDERINVANDIYNSIDGELLQDDEDDLAVDDDLPTEDEPDLEN